ALERGRIALDVRWRAELELARALRVREVARELDRERQLELVARLDGVLGAVRRRAERAQALLELVDLGVARVELRRIAASRLERDLALGILDHRHRARNDAPCLHQRRDALAVRDRAAADALAAADRVELLRLGLGAIDVRDDVDVRVFLERDDAREV